MVHSNISFDESMSVSDLVLELDSFIDGEVLKQVERNLYFLNEKNTADAVSYTHLTLPTICSV